MDKIKTVNILIPLALVMLGALIYANRDKFSGKTTELIRVRRFLASNYRLALA